MNENIDLPLDCKWYTAIENRNKIMYHEHLYLRGDFESYPNAITGFLHLSIQNADYLSPSKLIPFYKLVTAYTHKDLKQLQQLMSSFLDGSPDLYYHTMGFANKRYRILHQAHKNSNIGPLQEDQVNTNNI